MNCYGAGTIACLFLACSTFNAAAQDPVKVLPHNYQVVFKNDFVEVVRVRYEPHEKLPIHDHSLRPTIYVYLTDSGPVRFSHQEAHPFALIRRPVKAGDFRVSPGRIEKHEVENLGDIPTEFLRVELKQMPLGLDTFQYRGNKGFDLSKTATHAEFASPQIAIQRMILAKEGDQQSIAAVHPALLMAFSPTFIKAGSAPAKRLQTGDAYWLDINQSVRITRAKHGAAHLLIITFMKVGTEPEWLRH
jgi:hypothetical protein